jgi:hypothetical protein
MSSSLQAFFRRSTALLALLILGACAQLPQNVDRPLTRRPVLASAWMA